ncbi:hypothetical protein Pelo_14813 [Pelomyxa schiedti]|nr:hypothetical protein Pelo_14813 [Pelomyxa schiedti]
MADDNGDVAMRAARQSPALGTNLIGDPELPNPPPQPPQPQPQQQQQQKRTSASGTTGTRQQQQQQQQEQAQDGDGGGAAMMGSASTEGDGEAAGPESLVLTGYGTATANEPQDGGPAAGGGAGGGGGDDEAARARDPRGGAATAGTNNNNNDNDGGEGEPEADPQSQQQINKRRSRRHHGQRVVSNVGQQSYDQAEMESSGNLDVEQVNTNTLGVDYGAENPLESSGMMVGINSPMNGFMATGSQWAQYRGSPQGEKTGSNTVEHHRKGSKPPRTQLKENQNPGDFSLTETQLNELNEDTPVPTSRPRVVHSPPPTRKSHVPEVQNLETLSPLQPQMTALAEQEPPRLVQETMLIQSENRILKLESDIGQLEQALREQELNFSAELESQKHVIEVLSGQKMSLEENLSVVTAQFDEFVLKAKQAIALRERENSHLSNILMQKQRTEEELKRRERELSSHLSSMQTEMDLLQKKLSTTEDLNAQLTEKVCNLSSQLARSQQRHTHNERALSELELSYDDKCAELTRQSKTMDSLDRQLRESQAENMILDQQLKELHLYQARLESEVSRLSMRSKMLERELNRVNTMREPDSVFAEEPVAPPRIFRAPNNQPRRERVTVREEYFEPQQLPTNTAENDQYSQDEWDQSPQMQPQPPPQQQAQQQQPTRQQLEELLDQLTTEKAQLESDLHKKAGHPKTRDQLQYQIKGEKRLEELCKEISKVRLAIKTGRR